jgi:predicted house-cleaning noncanonical NTP pyrophosphatase (MazG superfamily)
MKLEKARQRREERKSKLAQKVAENIDNFAREKYLEEVNISDYVVNTLRDIKRSKSARNLKLKGGSVKVDMNTANMMLQVLDKINPMNKKKIMDILDKGTKNDFMKVHGAVMKAIR